MLNHSLTAFSYNGPVEWAQPRPIRRRVTTGVTKAPHALETAAGALAGGCACPPFKDASPEFRRAAVRAARGSPAPGPFGPLGRHRFDLVTPLAIGFSLEQLLDAPRQGGALRGLDGGQGVRNLTLESGLSRRVVRPGRAGNSDSNRYLKVLNPDSKRDLPTRDCAQMRNQFRLWWPRIRNSENRTECRFGHGFRKFVPHNWPVVRRLRSRGTEWGKFLNERDYGRSR